MKKILCIINLKDYQSCDIRSNMAFLKVFGLYDFLKIEIKRVYDFTSFSDIFHRPYMDGMENIFIQKSKDVIEIFFPRIEKIFRVL